MLTETGAPGWAEVGIPDLVARVLIKVAEKEGRYVIETMIVSDGALDSVTIKRIPVSRIETLLNQGAGVGLLGPSAQAVYEVKGFTFSGRSRVWSQEFSEVEQALSRYLAGMDRPSFTPGATPSAREPLARPDGTDPDGFYRKVAEAYSEIVVTSASPAKVIAEEAEVPVTTVHRWINEARRRGFLPPARKGRAG
jgi:hypothetical protein